MSEKYLLNRRDESRKLAGRRRALSRPRHSCRRNFLKYNSYLASPDYPPLYLTSNSASGFMVDSHTTPTKNTIALSLKGCARRTSYIIDHRVVVRGGSSAGYRWLRTIVKPLDFPIFQTRPFSSSIVRDDTANICEQFLFERIHRIYNTCYHDTPCAYANRIAARIVFPIRRTLHGKK